MFNPVWKSCVYFFHRGLPSDDVFIMPKKRMCLAKRRRRWQRRIRSWMWYRGCCSLWWWCCSCCFCSHIVREGLFVGKWGVLLVRSVCCHGRYPPRFGAPEKAEFRFVCFWLILVPGPRATQTDGPQYTKDVKQINKQINQENIYMYISMSFSALLCQWLASIIMMHPSSWPGDDRKQLLMIARTGKACRSGCWWSPTQEEPVEAAVDDRTHVHMPR